MKCDMNINATMVRGNTVIVRVGPNADHQSMQEIRDELTRAGFVPVVVRAEEVQVVWGGRPNNATDAVVKAAARLVAMRSFHGTQDAHEMEYADREAKLFAALRALDEVKP